MNTHFIIPKPKSWAVFEEIVCDLYSRVYGCSNLQRYGRQGQRQKGVDVAGLISEGVLGIQCKHKLRGRITANEVAKEVEASESFEPKLGRFIVATSDDHDAELQSYVMQIKQERVGRGDYPVEIKFWEDICEALSDFPDLMYKHFTQYFTLQRLEDPHYPSLDRMPQKETAFFPTSSEQVYEVVDRNLGDVEQASPYEVTIGFTTFADVSFRGKADIELQVAEYFQAGSSEDDFNEAVEILGELKRILASDTTYFSKTLWIYLQARLTPSFLLGWVFRRVTHYRLRLVSNGQVWTTDDLLSVESRLIDDLPIVLDQSSDEVALVLNIHRNIDKTVVKFVRTWQKQPQAVVVSRIGGNTITSAAHALAVARVVSNKIKAWGDSGRVRRVHLFGAIPAALATLIGYHLNATCSVSIYFWDEARASFHLGGTLTNDL